MKSKKITIKSFNIKDNYFIITDKYNNEYYLKIIDGSIETEIMNTDNENVGIKYLEENDIIKIYGSNLKSNKFIIKKIYIKTKYQFNSESSDDFDIYN